MLERNHASGATAPGPPPATILIKNPTTTPGSRTELTRAVEAVDRDKEEDEEEVKEVGTPRSEAEEGKRTSLVERTR